MQGPSPGAYCSCSMSALTLLVVHTEPHGNSPDISMIPAPVMPVTSAHTSHNRLVSRSGAPWPTSRVSIRIRRSLAMVDGPTRMTAFVVR